MGEVSSVMVFSFFKQAPGIGVGHPIIRPVVDQAAPHPASHSQARGLGRQG